MNEYIAPNNLDEDVLFLITIYNSNLPFLHKKFESQSISLCEQLLLQFIITKSFLSHEFDNNFYNLTVKEVIKQIIDDELIKKGIIPSLFHLEFDSVIS